MYREISSWLVRQARDKSHSPFALLVDKVQYIVVADGRTANHYQQSIPQLQARFGIVLFEHDLFARALYPQARPRRQVEFIAQFLGNHDPPRLIDLHNGIHNAILPLKMAFLMRRDGFLPKSARLSPR